MEHFETVPDYIPVEHIPEPVDNKLRRVVKLCTPHLNQNVLVAFQPETKASQSQFAVFEKEFNIPK